VFGPTGRVAREFGDPEQISERNDLNRYVSIGRLAFDPEGHIYYGYTYLPESLVRQYDRFDSPNRISNLRYRSIFRGSRPAQGIERQEKRTETSVPPAHFSPRSAWILSRRPLARVAQHSAHFDKEGNRRSEYQIYTKDGARIEASVLLVEEGGCSSAPIRSACTNSPGRTETLIKISPRFPQVALH